MMANLALSANVDLRRTVSNIPIIDLFVESGDCAMNITNIKQADSGTWRCNVTCTKCDNGKYDVGTNKIDVIVAIPPGKSLLVMGLLYRDFIKVEAILRPGGKLVTLLIQ